MTNPLHPCPHCQRHIRANESSCPFCDGETAGAFDHLAQPRLPTRRLSRAALLALGTMAASVPLSACAGEDDGENSTGTGGINATTDGEGAGGSEMSTAGDGAGGADASTGGDSGGAAVYGVPPSGGANSAGTGGDGSIGPVYGVAPSGGADGAGTGGDGSGGTTIVGTGGDDGGIAPVYGIAPSTGGDFGR